MTHPPFEHPPPQCSTARLSFPNQHILLVSLNRPKSLNCINLQGHFDLDAVWKWLDAEPLLRIGIITGEGRAFCAGADLKDWGQYMADDNLKSYSGPSSGFAGISRRRGRKPIIAAVNGLAHGGGCEIAVNCDLVFASPNSTFALPEAKRGLVVLGGALPRLARIVGRTRAMEMALTGRNVSAGEAKVWGLCNEIAENDGEGISTKGGVVELAVNRAAEICKNSPDSVFTNKEGIELAWDGIGADEATQRLIDGMWRQMEGEENMKEGLRAFVEKRPPRWVNSKL